MRRICRTRVKSPAVYEELETGIPHALTPARTNLTDPIDQAAIQILTYLIAHRDARDTIEGIEKWWVRQSNEYGSGDIAEAVHRLEGWGLVRAWKAASAKPVYGRASADVRPLQERIRRLEAAGRGPGDE